MFKRENIIINSNTEERNKQLMDRVNEFTDTTVISFSTALKDKGREGATKFFLDVEGNFTRRIARENNAKLLVIFNNSEDLFNTLKGHYQSVLLGFAALANAVESLNTEFIIVAESEEKFKEATGL